MCVCVSCPVIFNSVISWAAAHQAPPSVEFSRQEYWSGLPFPTPVLLPGKFHGRRSLVGYSPWDRKESDTTERLHFLSFYRSLWRRKWQPTPVFLPGESHGQRGLVGYSLWGCKELNTTKQLTHIHIYLLYNLLSAKYSPFI